MSTGFSSGFETSFVEIVLFISIAGALTLALIVAAIVRKRSSGQRRGKKRVRRRGPDAPAARHRIGPRRERPTLDAADERTLKHMAWFLRRSSDADVLLEDPGRFRRAARAALREGLVRSTDVIHLAGRAGVDITQVVGLKRSTSTIPQGSEVSLADKDAHVAHGEVTLEADAGLGIRLVKSYRGFRAGDAIEVLVSGSDGLYRFESAILSRDGREVVVSHNPHVDHVQRRRHRRRKLTLPIRLSVPGVVSAIVETRDVSLGGAAIPNPKRKLTVGSPVQIAVARDGYADIPLKADVVRVSRSGKIAHIQFRPADEATRHALFKRIMVVAQR